MCARPSSTRLAIHRSAYALARVSSFALETGETLRRFAWLAATLARPAISGPAFKLAARRRPFDVTKTQSFSRTLRFLPSNSARTATHRLDPHRAQDRMLTAPEDWPESAPIPAFKPSK